ncbi:hypothetical protein [Apilactobacillus timberlakei]|uniref:TMhelix containing protein n=1 Tax=Apilactobacillus timberlakei TaxID=2008380 RepID=A0ABY2YVM4_9LACO|nr:hypothetical protein [Apilactobacillus timberlakei]TPR12780.1 hypothetical protein DY048_07155 [Apilactobacillus timberlakei]TPR13663.1 hypothetical protein DY052_08025 [Apilactobacillus timberlakei]
MNKAIINGSLSALMGMLIVYFIGNTYFASTFKGQIVVVVLLLIELILASTAIADLITNYKK